MEQIELTGMYAKIKTREYAPKCAKISTFTVCINLFENYKGLTRSAEEAGLFLFAGLGDVHHRDEPLLAGQKHLVLDRVFDGRHDGPSPQ